MGTSKTAATKVIGRFLNFATKVYLKQVYEYLYGEKDDKRNEVKKTLSTVDRMDILRLLPTIPRKEAWGDEEEVSATTLLLVNCFCKIDPHYRYTKKELKVSVAEDEVEDGDDLFEER